MDLDSYLKYLDERQDIPPYSFKVNPSGPKMSGGSRSWGSDMPLQTQFYISFLASALIWAGLRASYRVIRSLIDKTYRRCLAQSIKASDKRRKPVYNACMYFAKLKGLEKGLQLLKSAGPKKCKQEKNTQKCLETLQSKINKIKKDISKVRVKYNKAKKEAEDLKHKHKTPSAFGSGLAGIELTKPVWARKKKG